MRFFVPALDPAVIRAWAVATNRIVGSRGAIPAKLIAEYIRWHQMEQLRRTAFAAGRLALAEGPGVVLAVMRRSSGRPSETERSASA